MEYTVSVAGAPGAGEDKTDALLDALEKEPAALGPGGVGVEKDGSLSTLFQVEATAIGTAAMQGCESFANALRAAGLEPRVTRLEVWEGDADDDPRLSEHTQTAAT